MQLKGEQHGIIIAYLRDVSALVSLAVAALNLHLRAEICKNTFLPLINRTIPGILLIIMYNQNITRIEIALISSRI